jgi:V8-like Glu-specific endopeptidase
MKKFVLVLILLVGCIFEPGDKKFAKPYLNDAFSATCSIYTSNSKSGTGFMLDTGYILTAAHVVDKNKNQKIDPTENLVGLKFEGISEVATGTVIMVGKWKDWRHEDIAVIKVIKGKHPKSNIRLASFDTIEKLLPGEELFTVGFPYRGPVHITEGLLSTPVRDLSRFSASLYFGNSGGGVFLKHNQEVIGLVCRLLQDNRRVATFNSIAVYSHVIVPNQTLFVDGRVIRALMIEYGLERVVDIQADKKKSTQALRVEIISLILWICFVSLVWQIISVYLLRCA